MSVNQASKYHCSKCGCEQGTCAVRKVQLTVGWAHTVLQCVAPVFMCHRCGHFDVVVNMVVGDMLDVPPPEKVGVQARPQELAQEAGG